MDSQIKAIQETKNLFKSEVNETDALKILSPAQEELCHFKEHVSDIMLAAENSYVNCEADLKIAWEKHDDWF